MMPQNLSKCLPKQIFHPKLSLAEPDGLSLRNYTSVLTLHNGTSKFLFHPYQGNRKLTSNKCYDQQA